MKSLITTFLTTNPRPTLGGLSGTVFYRGRGVGSTQLPREFYGGGGSHSTPDLDIWFFSVIYFLSVKSFELIVFNLALNAKVVKILFLNAF